MSPERPGVGGCVFVFVRVLGSLCVTRTSPTIGVLGHGRTRRDPPAPFLGFPVHPGPYVSREVQVDQTKRRKERGIEAIVRDGVKGSVLGD